MTATVPANDSPKRAKKVKGAKEEYLALLAPLTFLRANRRKEGRDLQRIPSGVHYVRRQC